MCFSNPYAQFPNIDFIFKYSCSVTEFISLHTKMVNHTDSQVLYESRAMGGLIIIIYNRWEHLVIQSRFTRPESNENYLKLTESWRVPWWYSIVPVLFKISPLASPFAILSFFKRAFACASLMMVTFTWNTKVHVTDILHAIQ